MNRFLSIYKSVQAFLGAEEDMKLKTDREFTIDAGYMAFLVGVVAIFLPLALRLGTEFVEGCAYDSISHYNYSPALGAVFVGCLFFIGAFLLAYRGLCRTENILAGVAGTLAFCVALFPTFGDGCDDADHRSRPFVTFPFKAAHSTLHSDKQAGWFELWEPQTSFLSMTITSSHVHFAAAAVVFVTLAIFCLFIFPRIITNRHRLAGPGSELTRAKTVRNWIYVICGLTIVVALLLIAAHACRLIGWETETVNGVEQEIDLWLANNVTFWLETAMLWAFGISWAVKGRLGSLGRRVFGDYLLDPVELRRPAGETRPAG